MVDAALESYLHAWRKAHPQLAPAWTFLRDGERTRYGALAALEQQWLDAVYAIHESQVAAAKLQWWYEEIQNARAGSPRHPVTRTLSAQAQARAIPAALWNGAIAAALARLEAPTAADVAEQVAQAEPLHGALAALETALWFGMEAQAVRARRVATLCHLVAALARLPWEIAHDRSPLPMSLLARHGLTQAALGADSAARDAAIRDQVRALQKAFDETDKLAGPLSLWRGMQARLDRYALRSAATAPDPLAALTRGQGGPRSLLDAWHSARAWHAAQRP